MKFEILAISAIMGGLSFLSFNHHLLEKRAITIISKEVVIESTCGDYSCRVKTKNGNITVFDLVIKGDTVLYICEEKIYHLKEKCYYKLEK